MPVAEPPIRIRAGSLPGRLVIIRRQGAVEGICRRAVEDPVLGRVLGFAFEDDEWYEGPKFLPQAAVVGYGDNALLLDEADQILELHEAAEIRLILKQKETLIEKHVMTDAGKYIGEIFDYEFTADGRITGYYLHRFLAGEQTAVLMPAERTTRVGKNLILVSEGELLPTSVRPLPAARVPGSQPLFATAPLTPPAERARVHFVTTTPPRERTTLAPPDSLSDLYTQRQYAYLVGRRCERDILDDAGLVLIHRGHLIDETTIETARAAGKFMELAISSRTGGTLIGQPPTEQNGKAA